jgi:hypothetical protein
MTILLALAVAHYIHFVFFHCGVLYRAWFSVMKCFFIYFFQHYIAGTTNQTCKGDQILGNKLFIDWGPEI